MQSVGLVLIILAVLIMGLCMNCCVQIISQQKKGIEPAQESLRLPCSYLLLPLALCVMLNESFCFLVFYFPLCEQGENDIYLVA